MGLDTTHDCWHGAYSAFSRWRETLADVAGYCIWPLATEYGSRDTVMLEWHRYREGIELMGEWESTPHDPLIVLIAHCDCEGVIKPEQAGPLADRLEELLPLLPSEDDKGHIGNWRAKTQKFIDGLRNAVSRGETVEFH